jgi:membrane protein DedA with SNARE-associated domain
MLAEKLVPYILSTLDHLGYSGAALLMAGESMILPIPSEAVMPPMGMLLHPGLAGDAPRFTWTGAILATSLGSLLGSLVSYYLGYFGGKPLVLKVGRFLLLNEDHLDLTTRWFNKHGGITVFIARFVPVIRHFISIPAGIARMNLAKFILYTLVGATLWNIFLLWLGWKLQDHWNTILHYSGPIDIVMVLLLLVGVVAWYYLHLRKPKPAATSTENPLL